MIGELAGNEGHGEGDCFAIGGPAAIVVKLAGLGRVALVVDGAVAAQKERLMPGGADVAGVRGEAHAQAPDFEPDLIFMKELTIKGVRGRTANEMKKAIKLLASGKYPLHKLATHHFGLNDVEKAICTVGGEGEPGAIHVSVLPELR